MDAAHVLVVFLVIGGTFVIFSYKTFKKAARFIYLTTQVQGPSLWRLLTIHGQELLSDNMLSETLKMSEYYRYQPFGFWTFKTFVIQVSDITCVKEVFRSKYLVNKSTNFYKSLEETIGRGSVVLNGHNWRRHRQVITSVFHKKLVDLRTEGMNEEAVRLVEKLSEMASGQDLNFGDFVEHSLLKISVRFILSNVIPEDIVVKFHRAVAPMQALYHLKAVNPLSYWLFHKHTKSSKDTETLIQEAKTYARNLYDDEILVLKQSISEMGDSQPTNTKECGYLRNSKMGKYALNDEELFNECLTSLMASFETTSLATKMTIVLLALHQDIQQRTFDEIDSTFGHGQRYCTSNDVNRLEYLEMVIKEAARLYPPVPIIARQADEEINLRGVIVPKGSTVFINIMALHRNPENFDEPLKFNPDRFAPQVWQGRDPVSYIPFSYGQRNCVGQVQAMMMMKIVLSHLLRRFKILPGNGLNSMDDIKAKVRLTMYVEECCIRLVRRVH